MSADAKFLVFDKAGDIVEVAGEQMNPNPMVWPVCDTCGTTYVLRRCISLSQGFIWAWQRDCEKPKSTCKNASAAVHDAKGECPSTGRERVAS